MGAPGAAGASEQSFECPACRQPLAAAQVFSAAALRGSRAGAPAGTKLGPAAPGRVHGYTGSGAQNGAVKGEAAEGPLPPWQSSAKIEFLLRLLNELRDRNAAAALQCAP